MTAAEKYYHELADKIAGITKSKMFGALCLKAANGKAFAMFWKDEFMIFKLEGEELEKALKIKRAGMFDPMGGRVMNGWVQVPFSQKKEWEKLNQQAYDFVKTLKGK